MNLHETNANATVSIYPPLALFSTNSCNFYINQLNGIIISGLNQLSDIHSAILHNNTRTNCRQQERIVVGKSILVLLSSLMIVGIPKFR
jgi:hypothetical protein